MNVFELRNSIIEDYSQYIASFIEVSDERIEETIDRELNDGLLWPNPIIQLNPSFEWGGWIDDLVNQGVLHPECRQIFRIGKQENSQGLPMRLYQHQVDAILAAGTKDNYVLTTGTSSGKSLTYIVPIVDRVLKEGSGKGIKAIIVYPMNALANSQQNELEKFLCDGFPGRKPPVTFHRYTGQESDVVREQIILEPPDILLTNYVMLELILTRPYEQKLIHAAQGLQFLVLDELHTYRGRQGADVAMLVRRLRNLVTATGSPDTLQCVGTSATLAGPGTFEEQRQEVAEVATKLFGSDVRPDRVISETLRRETIADDFNTPAFIQRLSERIQNDSQISTQNHNEFIKDPLSVWIEAHLGLETDSGRLVRCKNPLTIKGRNSASQLLSEQTGLELDLCIRAIQNALLRGYSVRVPETSKPIFAFKLHQFLSKGDTVFATPESESKRFITLQGQQFAPGSEKRKILLPLQFCRECGQEYYSVWKVTDPSKDSFWFSTRNPSESVMTDGEGGYLFIRDDIPWPDDEAGLLDRVPEDWVVEEKGVLRIQKHRRKYLPGKISITADGRKCTDTASSELVTAWFLPAPFTFCLRCGVSYNPRLSDFTKLATLGTEGRSTATTVLSLATIRHLRQDADLKPVAKKLLSFTDNRQDASLQAGHFNDFVQVGALRSALFNAMEQAGEKGLEHDVLTQKVFACLNLPLEAYSQNTDVDPRFGVIKNINKALWNVLGYRLYADLRRGWRIVAPNLEQCGLLWIDYQDLEAVAAADDLWAQSAYLATLPAERRLRISRTLLDFLRRRLAIKVDYLNSEFQEQIKLQSSQFLKWPWSLDSDEKTMHASVVFPRARQGGQNEYGGDVFISPKGSLALHFRRSLTDIFPNMGVDDGTILIQGLFDALTKGGLIEVVVEPRGGDTSAPLGYQIPASVMIWRAGDGQRAFLDPLRVKFSSEKGGRTNPFFVNLYRSAVQDAKGLEAREHTAQVPADERVLREDAFKDASLPVLYCSPTMELGVDIAQLNVVSLRNVPPTPANYAQRSGRAGRSGQPALVFTYCAQGNSHDQHFFKNPVLMVSGAVSTPRLDLANEDLIRAHVHAVWLTAAELDLKHSLKELLDISGQAPSLALCQGVKDALRKDQPKHQAMLRCAAIFQSLKDELQNADWFSDKWLEETISKIEHQFEQACERWRGLYRAALAQRDGQHRIIADATKSQLQRDQAKRLRSEAETQIDLLLQAKSSVQSDFYSYRYFASEGFLPGYNFPRLPLSAFIPGRRKGRGRDEFVARPRFLAISEFGPGSFIYHEGSRFVISRVITALEEDQELASGKVKQCPKCAYMHPVLEGDGPDKCEMCNTGLGVALTQLFRMRNVSTRRRDRINSDEEERTRFGYSIRTGYRFSEHGGHGASKVAEITSPDGVKLATLRYGHTATIWRINLGWANRKPGAPLGFLLNLEKGVWTKEGAGGPTEDNLADPDASPVQRVIPYVEDRKNCLLFTPQIALNKEMLFSLVAAIKQAVQRVYQLENFELAAEVLPAGDEPQVMLFYEAAEGGAGVLRRLVEDPNAMRHVAIQALELCHFDHITGQDRKRAPFAREDCEAACYDCLMSYANQRDHPLLDRHLILAYLQDLAKGNVSCAPADLPRANHLETLKKLCDTELERKWLDFLEARNLRLPSHAQRFIEQCQTRPDFYYAQDKVAVYVDGPHHDYPERAARDAQQTECLGDFGITAIRFDVPEQWVAIVSDYPHVFGRMS